MISEKYKEKLRDRSFSDLIEIRDIVITELDSRETELFETYMKKRFLRTGETS